MLDRSARETLITAGALSLGAAVALGLARFAYALLLPAMRADLGWSYFTAGAMNAANAAGYLGGALAAPRLIGRHGASRVAIAGTALSGLLLALHGAFRAEIVLYGLRAASGITSAAVFVAGGLLAARLAGQQALGRGMTPGLVLGLFYGGVGLGIVTGALAVPPLAGMARSGWALAWVALGALALLAAAAMAWRLRGLAPGTGAAPGGARTAFAVRAFAFALASYGMFGLGYIGYMTFIVTLLREQGLSAPAVRAFYALLGLAVMASPFLWAGLLQRHRDGQALARLSALLALATALPVAWAHPLAAVASGVLFGGVFLSLVASTTALVRHNLPPAQWAHGVSAFTIVFAIGQIVGPGVVGRLADGTGGLAVGFVASAVALLAGAGLALGQRALRPPAT